MNVDDLLEDEFVIECSVRSLSTDQRNLKCLLNAQLDLESKTPALSPKRPYESAYKDSPREIEVCGAILIDN